MPRLLQFVRIKTKLVNTLSSFASILSWLRQYQFHPLLFAAAPVLALYSANMGLVPLEDVYGPLAIALGSVLCIWALLGAVARSSGRVAISTSAAVFLFFSYGHIVRLLGINHDAVVKLGRTDWLQAAWEVLIILVMVAPLFNRFQAERFTRYFNCAGFSLVLFPCATIAANITHTTATATNLSVQGIVNSGSTGGTRAPDIFYIILDGYGRKDALEKFMNFSNEEFIKDLGRRGFYVAGQSRSNYCQTELSLASSLNLCYLQELLSTDILHSSDRLPLQEAVDRSRAVSYLRFKGYRYVADLSGAPNIKIHSADLVRDDQSGPSIFEATLMQSTPVGLADAPIAHVYAGRRQRIERAFEFLNTAGHTTATPRFIFAHILAPHPPFVFGPNGEHVTPKRAFTFSDGSDFYHEGGDINVYRDGYVGQLRYINKLTIKAIDNILASEDVPPVIIVQGDHGSKRFLNQDKLAETDVRECFRNLEAYYVPDSVKADLYPSITPVNAFRVIFNGLFGDSFALLPDESFYSPYRDPYRFTPVSAAQIEGKAPQAYASHH